MWRSEYHARGWLAAGGAILLALALFAGVDIYHAAGGRTAVGGDPAGPSLEPTSSAEATAPAEVEPEEPTGPAADTLTMSIAAKLSGDLSPKSVVAAPGGLVFAQNMMYRHTVSVFSSETRELVETIRDKVVLAEYGYPEYTRAVQGAPVEAAVSADGASMYVSNYSMYGPGFSRPGDDVGGPNSGVDDSFVYRINLASLKIDQAIQVGAVPKYLATTPDGRYLLVSNWISYTLSVVDVATGREVRQVDIGRYPRGMAVTPDSRYAYVAAMGSSNVVKVDLTTFETTKISVGTTPRHIVLSPDGEFLYITLNLGNQVVKYDLAAGKVVAKVSTGSQPRSMTISPDGTALYVVNYESDSVSKVRTSDMAELQEIEVGHHPIGITYVTERGEIWACCYSGLIYVFTEE